MDKTSFSIYNASAGSGKTYTLVKEYLKILFLAPTDDAYKKILAITFTNKAVNEMKSRVVSSLYAFSLPEVTQKTASLMQEIAPETGQNVALIREKSKRIIKNIIHNYAAFDISTIDKFTHKVIRSFAHDLNLPVSFDVSLETEALLQEAVDAIIAKAGSDKELTKLLLEFALEKADNDKSWDITKELLEVGSLLLNENNRNELKSFQEKSLPDFIALRKKVKEQKEKTHAEILHLAQEIMTLIQQNQIELKSFSGQYFPKHIQSILEDRFSTTSKKYINPEDIKINKTAIDGPVITSLIPYFLEKTNAIYALYGKFYFYEAFLKNLTPLSLLNSINLELNRIQEEQNVLSIAQFNAIINKEIQNQPAPFIYERLGEKYRHFFIDEFQDTSEMQWQNLIPLIDNALSGQDDYGAKGSLMIVGDPKQSIYRWRGGKAEQFIALSKDENPFSNPSKDTHNLETNYRSYSEVIAFNNRFFKQMAHNFSNPDYHLLYDTGSYQHINPKSGGYVQITLLEKNTDEAELSELTKQQLYLDKTLEVIDAVKAQGFEYADIVILTRRRSEGVLLANFLTEQNIPIISSETLLINNATEVRVLLNVLRYLKNDRDKEAKAQFLYFAAKYKQQDLPVHDFIAAGISIEDEIPFQNWLATHGIMIDFSFARKNSLYAATEYIVDSLVKEKKTLSYVQYFMDLVLERTVKYQSSITDFLTYWDSNFQKLSIPSPDNINAVQLMTIHKSKGLEFPVVIFPFAEEDYSRSRDKIWIDFEEEETLDIPKALIDLKNDVREYGLKAQELFDVKKQEQMLDNINVLYVALTRAEEQLYVISYKNINKSGLPNNLSSQFIRFLMDEEMYDEQQTVFSFGEQSRVSVKDDDQFRKKPVMITAVEEGITTDMIKIAEREAIMWDSQAQKAIEFGNLVHELMAAVRYKSDIDEVVENALSLGFLTKDKQIPIREMMEKIVNHPELQDFYNEKAVVYSERTILKNNYKNIKPDRVTVLGKKAYLLDYKTGNEQEKYIKQVNEYAMALEEMGYDVSKKVLLYLQDDLKIIHL